MRTLLMTPLFCVALSFMGLTAHAEVANVLGYQAWKATRVEEAKSSLDKLLVESGAEKPLPNGTPAGVSKLDKRVVNKDEPAGHLNKANRNDPKLQQAELNVEVAQELTVNDYFVLYLNQFKEKEALLEAAKKLSPEEVAELMMAYKKYLTGVDQADAQVPGLIGGMGSVRNP